MNLNHDLNQRVTQMAATAVWTPLSQPGIDRRMLDCIAGATAHVTSIVRYAADARVAAQENPGGEEIFVLNGLYSDVHGDYPAGTYVRHPPGTDRAAFSRDGCLLFVKQGQFAPGDTQAVQIATTSAAWYPGGAPGLSVMPLHAHEKISTALVRWAPKTRFAAHTHVGGEEILVLAGSFSDENGEYPAGTWLRSPRGSLHATHAGPQGAILYVKVGAIGARFLAPGG